MNAQLLSVLKNHWILPFKRVNFMVCKLGLTKLLSVWACMTVRIWVCVCVCMCVSVYPHSDRVGQHEAGSLWPPQTSLLVGLKTKL